jgi:energy-coupling factor transporter ATP-binding protein EcfA2
MYIEFIGASGAGKTTIVSAVAAALSEQGACITTRQNFFHSGQKRTYKLGWSALNIWRIDLVTLFYLGKWGRLTSYSNAGLKVHEYIKSRWIANNPEQLASLWDSGFVQLYSKFVVFGILNEEKAFRLIQKCLPEDSILVFLNTSIKEAIERKRGRALGWKSVSVLDRLEREIVDTDKMKITLDVQSKQIEMIDRLRDAGVQVVTLDGMLSSGENKDIVLDLIRKKLI